MNPRTIEAGAALLDNEATLEIQHLVRDFKPADGDLLGALHAVQHRYGYVPKMAIGVVARQLRLSEAKVYGALTFYSEFRLTPPPATLIGWCSSVTCRLKGGDHIRRILEAELGIGMGENTADNKLGTAPGAVQRHLRARGAGLGERRRHRPADARADTCASAAS